MTMSIFPFLHDRILLPKIRKHFFNIENFEDILKKCSIVIAESEQIQLKDYCVAHIQIINNARNILSDKCTFSISVLFIHEQNNNPKVVTTNFSNAIYVYFLLHTFYVSTEIVTYSILTLIYLKYRTYMTRFKPIQVDIF